MISDNHSKMISDKHSKIISDMRSEVTQLTQGRGQISELNNLMQNIKVCKEKAKVYKKKIKISNKKLKVSIKKEDVFIKIHQSKNSKSITLEIRPGCKYIPIPI